MVEEKYGVKDPKIIDRVVGSKVQQLRLSQGMSRQDLGDILGITHQQLQKYEKGVNRITVSRLADIAQALGVSVVYFFEGNEGVQEMTSQRLCMEVMRDFNRIVRKEQREAVRQIIKVLAAD